MSPTRKSAWRISSITITLRTSGKISVRLISSAICILSYPLWRFKTIPCQSGMTHQNTITTAGTRLLGSAYMTERRIMDMVAYLFSRDRAPKGYKHRLRTAALSYRLMFNYSLDRYQKDYDRQELWSNFFLRLPDLRHKIERYRIHSLMELEYRAAEYFMDTD